VFVVHGADAAGAGGSRALGVRQVCVPNAGEAVTL